MFPLDGNSVKVGFLTTLGLEIFRGVLNGAIRKTTPRQLVDAIDNDHSLWGEGEGEIRKYCDMIPSSMLGEARNFKEVVDSKYGGMTNLSLSWLKEDHPVYYNIVMNTDDNRGVIWLDKQIQEILSGLGIS